MLPNWGKRLVCLAVMLAAGVSLFAQAGGADNSMRGNYWLFGTGIGLDFNCNPPRLLDEGKIDQTVEGMATISDACGELQFYTEGDSVWSKDHMVMPGLAIPLAGSRQSTQSSLILPKPLTSNRYYIFTVDGDQNGNANGLSYSEIEIIGPTWNYIVANVNLVQFTQEMVTACSDGTGGYWVATKMKGQAEIHAYHVTDAGVNTTPVVSSTGFVASSGQMKFSPDGRYLVIARPLQVYKFNINTGEATVFINMLGTGNPNFLDDGNSIEFSPSGKYLYTNNFNSATNGDGIWQFNLSLGDPGIINNTGLRLTNGINTEGGLQLGPDGKIYVIERPSDNHISVIEFPEREGSLAHYKPGDINLFAKKPGKYFPNFNQSWFDQEPLFAVTRSCHNDSTQYYLNTDYWNELVGGNKIDSVVWSLQDTGTSSAKVSATNASHVYHLPGCYNVTVIAYSSAFGGSVSKTKLIKINPTPTVELGPKDTTLCTRPRILWLNGSTIDNPNAVYNWYYLSFPDIANPPPDVTGPPLWSRESYTYAKEQEGRYWLVKTYRCCSNSDTINVYHDSIIPQFKVNDNLQCLRDNQYIFSNISKPSFIPGSTTWVLDNGQKPAGDVASAHYTNAQPYYVKMRTVSDKGCIGEVTRIMLVVKHPQSRFILDTLQQCFENNIFKVKDSSTIEWGHGSIQKWNFNTGDSIFTTQKQFTKRFSKPGTFTMSLITTSSQDCRDTAYQTVKVVSQPEAGFTIDDTSQCLSANNFEFTDTSTTSIDPINYRKWLFGDGSPEQDRSAQPLQFSRSYNSVDSFQVTLQVGTGIGCFDTTKKYVYVHGDPYVDFSIDKPQQCLNDNVFNFTDTTHTVKGYVQTLLWDFGDSTPIATSGKNKVYSKYGAYTVKMRAITNKGCTDSVSKNILLHPMPEAGFTANTTITCFKDHNFAFSAAPSFIPVGTIASYTWDFGDATGSALKDPPNKKFANDSSRTVLLTLVSDKGCIDTVSKFISFYGTPIAVAYVDKQVQCLEENLFYYKADSSTAGNSNIKEYLWEFGDGTIDLSENPGGKFYIKPDSFTVKLKITTDENCIDTASLMVKVLPSPVANFSVDPTCLFKPSFFINKSSSNPGNIITWAWNLGDGTTTSDSTPVHTYANTGTYTVSLTVVSDYGCQATVTKVNEAVVKALPQAKFGFERTDYDAVNTTVQFIDSSIDADQWYWDLGIGGITTQQNPLIVFTDTATLAAQLIISNSQGCFDTLQKTLFIAPDFYFDVPNAFTPNRDEKNPTFGGEGTRYFQEYYLRIYNRWGQMVFEADNAAKKWDGTYNGEACPGGVYTYVYRLRDVYGYYHNYSGVVNLIR